MLKLLKLHKTLLLQAIYVWMYVCRYVNTPNETQIRVIYFIAKHFMHFSLTVLRVVVHRVALIYVEVEKFKNFQSSSAELHCLF